MFYIFKSKCLLAKRLAIVDKLVTTERLVIRITSMVNIVGSLTIQRNVRMI